MALGLGSLFSGQPASPGLNLPPQGLADLLFPGSGFANFIDSRANTLGAIGAGLASGTNIGQGLSAAAQNVPAARRADLSQNLYRGQVSQTVQYLQQTHPDLAQAVQSGVLSPADAFQQAFALDNPKLTPTDPWQVMRNPQTGEIKGPAVGGSDATVDPNNPPMGQAVGNPQQLDNGQWAIATSMGGLRYLSGGPGGSGGAPASPQPGVPAQGGFDKFGNAPRNLNLMAQQQTAPQSGAPSGTPSLKSPAQVAADTAALVDRAKAVAAKPEQAVAAKSALDQLSQSDALNTTFIQTAIKQADDLGSTGWVGKLSEAIPGSPAYKLSKTLDTVKANIGFDKLQAMRSASPSGGALGQVSNFEEQLLQSVQGSLDQGQDAATIKANLTRLLDYMAVNNKMRQDAYQKDFGGISAPSGAPMGGAPAAAPAQPSPAPVTKTLNGVTYFQQNGQWYQQ